MNANVYEPNANALILQNRIQMLMRIRYFQFHLYLSANLIRMHTRTHARTHARAHARTHARTHTHTHAHTRTHTH